MKAVLEHFMSEASVELKFCQMIECNIESEARAVLYHCIIYLDTDYHRGNPGAV